MPRTRFVILASSATLAAAAVIAAAPATASGTGSVAFPGSVPSWATASADQGAATTNPVIEGEIYLALPDQQAAQAEALAVSTPGTAAYHHYLTPSRWISTYAPTSAAYQQVVDYVTSHKLTIVAEPKSREYIVFRGRTSQIAAAFSTSEHLYAHAGTSLIAPSSAPKLPASIGRSVLGVSIDQGASLTHTDHVGAAGSTAAPAASTGVKPQDATPPSPYACSTYYGQHEAPLPPAYGVTSSPTYLCGYSTTQIGGAYGVTRELTAGISGKGQTVAIVDAYDDPTILGDSQRIEQETGTQLLTAQQFKDVSPAASTFDDKALCQEPSDWQIEESIDVQAAHGMAPGANVLYSGGFDCEGGLDAAVSKILDNGLATIVSNSYGDAGENLSANALVGEEDIQLQAAGEGIGLYFSSGDSGDEVADLGYKTPDFPPSSPYVTAVGGTSLAVSEANTYEFETAWGSTLDKVIDNAYSLPLPGAFLGGGSGGGISTEFAEPSYQKDLVPTALSGTGADAARVEPDVASDADPYTGFEIGVSPLKGSSATRTGAYGVTFYGGTSLASPLYAGQVALAQSVAGTDIGFANPAIYALAKASPTAFRDVPATPKKLALAYLSPFSGNLYRVALGQDSSLKTTAGYDDATGVGSGNLPGLIKLAEYGE